jgi:hypothetical protein
MSKPLNTLVGNDSAHLNTTAAQSAFTNCLPGSLNCVRIATGANIVPNVIGFTPGRSPGWSLVSLPLHKNLLIAALFRMSNTDRVEFLPVNLNSAKGFEYYARPVSCSCLMARSDSPEAGQRQFARVPCDLATLGFGLQVLRIRWFQFRISTVTENPAC